MVDSADKRRLQVCRDELHQLLGQEKLAGSSLLIFANKQDLAGAINSDGISQVLELGSDQFKSRHWQIHPCSAVTGDGLIEGMDWIVNDISSRIFMGD